MKDQIIENTINYAGLVSFYFIVYFIFEITKNRLSSFWLKTINILVLVGIGMFIFLIVIFIFSNKISPNIFLLLFKIPFWGIIIPLILTFIISFNFRLKNN